MFNKLNTIIMIMDSLVPIFVVGFITLCVYKLFELYAKRKERILMIEKLAHLCENNEDTEKRLKIQLPLISVNNSDFGYWPLRISLLLIGIGIGCLCAFLLQMSAFGHSFESYRDYVNKLGDIVFIINFASISIFGGIGLLTAFLIEQKMKTKKKEED